MYLPNEIEANLNIEGLKINLIVMLYSGHENGLVAPYVAASDITLERHITIYRTLWFWNTYPLN